MWEGVAKIFGKEVPQAAKAAADLRDTIMGDMKTGKVPPEQIAELEKAIMQHEERMKELLLEEKKLEFESEKLEFEDAKGVRELEMAAYQVDDPYVRQTRPMILRKMFYICCIYAFYAPLSVIALHSLGFEKAQLKEIVNMVEWIGGWLFGTFGSAYLGYAAARSVDKKNPQLKNEGGVIGKITDTVLRKG